MARYQLEAEGLMEIVKAVTEAGKNAESMVNEVLHQDAGGMIMENIMHLLPASGREWKGKHRAASRSVPFLEEGGNLSVTVRTKLAYHYLYFPDDGGNTERHAGNQQFMYRGGEKTVPDIIRLCTARIIEKIGG